MSNTEKLLDAWIAAYDALDIRLTVVQDALDQAQRLIAAIEREAAARNKPPF